LRVLFALPLFLLIACDPADPGPDQVDDEVELPAENPWGEARSCTPFETGTVQVEVAGQTRTLEVELPENPEGAPVLFAWHWWGGNATETLDWMGIRGLADEGYIIVAPESAGSQFEWDFNDASDNNADLALFDAVLPCLWDQYQVDHNRVYSTGMSAGGLMTTWLTMHRSDVLAATAPFSGGAMGAFYTEPERDVPVLITWGGPSDTYAGYNFHTASMSFDQMLRDDGHFTIACEHSAGHLPPTEAVGMLATFFGDHRFDSESPWLDGLPATLPSWCE